MKIIVNSYVAPKRRIPDKKQKCFDCGSLLEVEEADFDYLNSHTTWHLNPWKKGRLIHVWAFDCAACNRRNIVKTDAS